MTKKSNIGPSQSPETYFWSELEPELRKCQNKNGWSIELPDRDLTCEQNWPLMGSPKKNMLNNVIVEKAVVWRHMFLVPDLQVVSI